MEAEASTIPALLVANAADHGSKPVLVTVDSLSPGGTYQAVMADLEKQSRRATIALVGHEPGLGDPDAGVAAVHHQLLGHGLRERPENLRV